MTPAEADATNDSTSTPRYYLFGPDQLPIGPDGQPLRTGDYDPGSSCEEALSDFDSAPGKPPKYAKGTACLEELKALGSGGPPAGSRVIEVPKGIVVVEAERVQNQPAADQALLRARGRLRAQRHGHQEPEVGHRPQTPARGDHGVHRQGPGGVRAGHEADRRARLEDHPAAGHARASRPSSASRSRWTTRSSRWRRSTSSRTPRASTGARARRSRTSGASRRPTTSPRACGSGRCRSSSS